MKRNMRKSEVIDMANNETEEGVLEENAPAKVGKTKWSLKKKLLIGGGIVVGLVVGAVALGSKKTTKPEDDQAVDSEYEDEETSSDDAIPEETAETVEG